MVFLVAATPPLSGSRAVRLSEGDWLDQVQADVYAAISSISGVSDSYASLVRRIGFAAVPLTLEELRLVGAF